MSKLASVMKGSAPGKRFLLSWVLALSAGPALSLTPEIGDWKQAMKEGKIAESRGDYVEAVTLFKRALTIADRSDPTLREVGLALCGLLQADVYTPGSDNDEYEQLMKLLMDQRKNHRDVSVDAYAMEVADTYLARKDTLKREINLLRAVVLTRIVDGDNQQGDYEAALKQLIQFDFEHHKSEEALKYLGKLEEITYKKYGPQSDELANVYNEIALNASSIKRYEQAGEAELRCVAIAQRSPDEKMKARIPMFYALIGRNAIQAGDIEVGKKFYKIAIDSCIKSYGPMSKPVGLQTYFLAQALRENGKYKDAEPLFKHVLSIYEKFPRSPDVEQSIVSTWDQLYLLYSATHETAKALQSFKTAQELRLAYQIK